jgi:prolyl oligopeptidase
MSRLHLIAASFVVLALGCPAPTPAPAPTPKVKPRVEPVAQPEKPWPGTRLNPVEDTYHGVKVSDPYRWLEANDAAVADWKTAQNGYTRSVLDKLPDIAAVKARMTKVLSKEAPSYTDLTSRGGKLFAIKRQPPKQQAFLIVLPSADEVGDAKVVVDPNVIDAKGTTAIDFYVPSPDGKRVAVSLSKGGTETGDLHFYDVATGKEVGEVIPRVNGGTAGGTAAWSPDGKGIYYSRYPREGEREGNDLNFWVQVYFHALGTEVEKDTYELGKDFPRIAEYELRMDDKSGRLLCTVQNGDGGEFSLHLRDKDGKWRTFAEFKDRHMQAIFGQRNDLYVMSRNGAPRGKVLRLDIDKLDFAKAETIVPEGEDTIVDSFWAHPSVLPTKNRLYVLYQRGGPSEIRVFDLKGKALAAPPQLPVAAADGMTRVGDDDILFENWSFVEPSGFYRVSAKDGSAKKTSLRTPPLVDMSKVTVVREFATSKDGTKVPVNILVPEGHEKDGKGACVVTGYGGYGVSITPRYRPAYSVLLEQGVCYAMANLRGGGEFGEEWHTGGNLTRKQNVFDDFIAVLEHMVLQKYASRDRLAITGGSNGGLLMGATMTQRPDLVKAVVSFVGIYDMLRVELSPNGAFNVTEFGTVKDPDLFKALYAYSPYHRVKDGTAYPTTLMLSGDNDPRVDPMQSRKMIARLQAATSGTAPIMLRTSADAGHGGDTSLAAAIAEQTDAYAFLLSALGVSYRPVP